MKENGKIYIIKSKFSEELKKKINYHSEEIAIDDLIRKDEKYQNVVVFIDGNKNYLDKIKEILLINPGISFILYFSTPPSPSMLVDFVKSGVVESVSMEEDDELKALLTSYGKKSKETKLNYCNNLIRKFRDIGIITNSMIMVDVFSKVEKIANSNSTVLIYGENGTGKELIARSIHYFSQRRDFKFVGVNTGAIPENLLEDELFGHVKGAFTSAMKDRKGKFEYAHKGTVFLDEISNMPQALQVKLLRVLQEREFERIGDNQSIPVDVRVIAATNKNLKELVEKEQFREDLFYRLNVIPLNLPPLRDRKTDIPVLANYFIIKYCRINNLRVKSFTLPAIRILKNYSWPGNIRQLENIVERMVVLNPYQSVLLPKDIPAEIKPEIKDLEELSFIPDEIPDDGLSLNDIVKKIEKKLILNSLEKTSWNKQKAANLLKIKRTTLIEKIKKIQK